MEFEIERSPSLVRFWSSVRLPFEPKQAARAARDHLREAVRGLSATGTVAATFTSSVPAFFDVENVLFYNVGTGSFGGASTTHLQFRRHAVAPPKAPSGRDLPHLHVYQPTPIDFPARRHLVARSFVLPRKLTASSVWAAARRSAVTTGLSLPHVPAYLLQVKLELPNQRVFSLASAMKPLLDGIVASLHRHEEERDSHELARRVASETGDTPDDIRNLLTVGPDELGTCQLLHRFREHVQWNPADHLVSAGDLVVQRVPGTEARCDANLFSIE